MSTFQDNVIDTTGRKYWFVRTDAGTNFDSFLTNDFVAIGWDKITLKMFKSLPDHQLRAFIETEYVKPKWMKKNDGDYDPESPYVKAAITGIINKINAFDEINKDDIVIIPSDSSFELGFGIIEDDTTYEETDDKCKHFKRRKVEWIKREKIGFLDAKFMYIRTPNHAISEINKDYHDIINSTMFTSFLRDGFSNISMKLRLLEDIDYFSLKNLIDGLIEVAKAYNDKHGIVQSTEELERRVFIKLNLQSPGFFNLKETGAGLLFALSIFATACTENGSVSTEDPNGSVPVTKSYSVPYTKTKEALQKEGLENVVTTDTLNKLTKSGATLQAEFDKFDSIMND